MRYYFHGDIKEGEPDLVYCAKCDAFEPISHFYEPCVHSWSRHTDYERFERMRKKFDRMPGMAFDGTEYTRPRNAPNIFALTPLRASVCERCAVT